jgi:hypothetical protein
VDLLVTEMPEYCGCCGKFVWPNGNPPEDWKVSTTEHSVHRMPVCTLSVFSHTLPIGHQFSEYSGTSSTHLNLRFGIMLLLHLILLAFLMLILQVVGLIERALLIHVIFLDLLLFADLLKNNL